MSLQQAKFFAWLVNSRNRIGTGFLLRFSCPWIRGLRDPFQLYVQQGFEYLIDRPVFLVQMHPCAGWVFV